MVGSHFVCLLTDEGHALISPQTLDRFMPHNPRRNGFGFCTGAVGARRLRLQPSDDVKCPAATYVFPDIECPSLLRFALLRSRL